MDWQPPLKPAEIAETRILEGILSNRFPIDSFLPAERDLAEIVGVTRPTLREVLQRLAREGWLEIQQGKPTRVRNYWKEGSLAVLSVLGRAMGTLQLGFVVHLLDFRVLIAPTYARQAVKAAPSELMPVLDSYVILEDSAYSFAHADWELHAFLADKSENPVFRLLLNGFKDLYLLIGVQYFSLPENRDHSRSYYRDLRDCVCRGSEDDAEKLTRKIMIESLALARKMVKE